MVRDVPGSSNAAIGRRRPSRTEAEQCLKGGHRLPPTIVPKHKLIQVDLQLRLTDPMVGPNQPLLQVAPIARSASGTTEGTPLRSSVLRG